MVVNLRVVGWVQFIVGYHFGSRPSWYLTPPLKISGGGLPAMDGLLPDRATLGTWTTLREAATWGGLEAGLVRAVARQLGDPELNALPVLAVIPIEVFEAALGSATRGDRSLHETEKAQWRLVLSAIRVKYGAPSLFASTVSHTPEIPASKGVAAGSSGTKLKLKMSQIIDQGVDFEVEMLPNTTLQKMRSQYVISEGDNPLEKEEVTDAQLSCLFHKLQSGQPPFVDMGVWGPHGDRIARAMRFVSQQWRDGQWKAVELPGASSLDSWEKSWRIFRTAALMLQMATAASLDRYASQFRTRVLQHPDVWHLAAQADIRCRTEFWSQEKRKQEAFHATHAALSAIVPDQPWNSVIRASASHSEFWSREFEKQAMLYVMNSAKSVPAKPAGPSAADDQSWMKPQPKKKTNSSSGFDPQRKDGRYFRSKAGIKICYAWSRAADGCSNDRCDKGFAHICEWCRAPRKTIDCPHSPGWNPDKKEKPKGKGKSKGEETPTRDRSTCDYTAPQWLLREQRATLRGSWRYCGSG